MTKPLATPATEQVAPCRLHPKAYDLPSTKIISLRGQQWLARKLCGECPLLGSCARYALEVLEDRPATWRGMVVAGVPFPDRSSTPLHAAGVSALRLVEVGQSLEKAYQATQ